MIMKVLMNISGILISVRTEETKFIKRALILASSRAPPNPGSKAFVQPILARNRSSESIAMALIRRTTLVKSPPRPKSSIMGNAADFFLKKKPWSTLSRKVETREIWRSGDVAAYSERQLS